MQGAGVKQTRSVCSPRARAAAAGRSRRGFAKQIRGFSAQTISPIWMRCYRISAGHAPHQRNPKPAENRTLCRARALSKRYGNVGWDALSQWRPRRKIHPGIRAQNGTCFPDACSSGKSIPESRLKLGRAFRSISSTPKPMRPPFQNWVEESQNAIAGGQHDCRR